MRPVVLDTDVASRCIWGRLSGAEQAAPEWYGSYAVTFVTVGELLHWAEIRSWGGRSTHALRRFLEKVVVIDSDRDVSSEWGRIAARARRRGRRRPDNDTWIAACCIAERLPLSSSNIRDFADFAEHDGLMLLAGEEKGATV